MLDRYPQAFSMSEFFSAETGERQMMDRINPVRGYERGKQVVLLILFYSRCKYLFKNASNMTNVAGYLSHGEVRDIP